MLSTCIWNGKRRACSRVLVCLCLCFQALGLSPSNRELNRQSFELIWQTLQTGYWDSTMGGVDWKAAHEKYSLEVEKADSISAWRSSMERMIHLLPSSHLAIIPKNLYRQPATRSDPNAQSKAEPIPSSADEDDYDDTGVVGMSLGLVENAIVVTRVSPGSPAQGVGVRTGWILESVDGEDCAQAVEYMRSQKEVGSAARLVDNWLRGNPSSSVSVVFKDGDGHQLEKSLIRVQSADRSAAFGNLPPEPLEIEHRLLSDGVGYFRLSIFLDPVRVMATVEKTITESRKAPGLILDLRDNPGGMGLMATGFAGWFVDEQGHKLGTMKERDMILTFVVNPRPEPYEGRVAVLVNEGSASTTEILAEGLKDLGRARVFGSRTAGAALPSVIVTLPNGDRLQYPNANYTSAKGRVLEGQGVEPDVEVKPTIQALLAGRDLVLEAAQQWSKTK